MVSLRQLRRILVSRRARLIGLAMLAVGVALASAGAADAPPKLRVLVLSGLNNHDWRSTTPVVQKALAACDRFGPVDVTENPAALDAAMLAKYDVLVSNWTPYPDTRRTWSPATEAAFFEFIRRGGGLVGSRARGGHDDRIAPVRAEVPALRVVDRDMHPAAPELAHG